MKSSAPAVKPSTTSCMLSRDVSRITYTYPGDSIARIRRHSSTPSIPGITQSEMTIRQVPCARIARASGPSRAMRGS